MHPHKLENIIFAALSPNHCVSKYGPIIAHAIHRWQQIETLLGWNSVWHTQTPIFRYNRFRLGGRPIIFPQWPEQGIKILPDLMDGDVLR